MLEDELKQSLVFALRNARTHQAISLMGFNRVDFLLLQALIETDAPWTVASLAHYIQQPTASVQRRLESSLACGTVNRVGDKGIVLTRTAREVFSQGLRELARIVDGHQAGFSEDIFDAAEKRSKALGIPPPNPKAFRLNYPRLDL